MDFVASKGKEMVETKNLIGRYGLPKEIKRCTRCVVSNQRPRITFDEHGVCSACRYAEQKHNTINWESRWNELEVLCDKYRKSDGSYDVLVPCSGGKDGTMVAWIMKEKLGMNPLCVTWAPHLFTDIGFRNLQNFIASGFDHIMISADGQVHRKLTKIAFEEMGDPFQPFIFGQYSAPFRVANQYDIKMVMYGEDGEVEYGGSMETANRASVPWEEFVKNRWSSLHPERFEKAGITKKDLQRYTLSETEIQEMREKDVNQYFMSYFRKWVPQENYYIAAEKSGFQANELGRSEGTYSKYASLDDKLDGFHYYLMFIKFGFGRCTSDAAHEIRDGHITREEGLALVKKFDGEFPDHYYREFLEYCGMTDEEFWKVIDTWRSPHIWETRNGEWTLKEELR